MGAVALRPNRKTRAAGLGTGQLPIVALGAFAILLVFRTQIFGGFHRVFSDAEDGFIEIAILEHWYNVFRSFEGWAQIGYFHPVQKTLGYNDAYFLYGVLYSLFRAAGADIFLASELVNMAVRICGYGGFYLAARRILDLDWRWASFGALLFTISNNAYLHAHHQQLLSVSFAPVMAVLLHGTLRALLSRRSEPLLSWGISLGAFYAAWLLTSFYMAWFCGLFALFFCALRALLSTPQERMTARRVLRRHWRPLLATAVLFLLFCLPFLALYLPKARETGMHDYRAVLQFTPSLLDVFDVGADNLLFGWLDRWINSSIRPGFPSYGERTTGFPPGLLLLFGAAVFQIWRGKASAGLRAMAGAAVLSWILMLHVGSASLYPLIYGLVPGAKAVRVVARYQIFLAAPVIGLVVVFLAHHARRWNRWALALLCLLLATEEINLADNRQLDREAQLARLEAIPPAPPQCRSFYVSKADLLRTGIYTDGIYRHSADAMVLAELLHLPTINGYASFVPPDYYLFFPDSPDYAKRVIGHAARYGLEGLCGLDMKARRWKLGGPIAPPAG